MIQDIINYLIFLQETGERELIFDVRWLTEPHVQSFVQPAEKLSILLPAEHQTPNQYDLLAQLFYKMQQCHLCSLAASRHKQVFGAGKYDADLMIIGESPGEEEDMKGMPFVGAAGKLLDKMLACIQLNRQDLFITNVLKCRPPANRNPQPEEIVLCTPYLFQQITIIKPRIILCLGLFAAQTILQTTLPIHQLRQRIHQYHNYKVIVTYHPSALLRDESLKRAAWEDLKLLQKTINEPHNQ